MKKSKLIKLKQHYLQHRHDDAIFNENLHKTVPNVTVDVYLESCDLKNSKEEKSTYFDDIDEASYISREELLYREDYLNYLEGIGYWNEDYIFLEQNNEQVEWWDMVGRQEDSKLVSIESILPLYKKFKCINSC